MLRFPHALELEFASPAPICIRPGCAVWRAARSSDGLPVVLKIYEPSRTSEDARLRLRRAARISREAASDAICRTLALRDFGRMLALVTEDIGGTSLDVLPGSPLTLAEVLSLGVQIAGGLAALHRRGLLHASVCPQHVVYERSEGRAQLIDLDHCFPIGEKPVAPRLGAGVDETLACAAPEMTGRIDQPVLEPADLYSLGTVLYEQLVGAPPFPPTGAEGTSTFEALLIRPRAPHELKPEIPEPVSAVVMKLLAHRPVDRYNTAEGLQADLIALAAAQREGRTSRWFLPGGQDPARSVRPPRRLLGRAAALDTLVRALARTREGSAGLVLLTGPAGVGKTSVVEAFRRSLGGELELWGQGRSDGLQNRPLAALLQAVRDALGTVLAGTEECRAAYRTAVLRDTGSAAGVLASLLPEIELLLGGPAPPPIDLPPAQAHNRLRLLLVRLVRLLAGPKPLVLFLDDLQWAEPSTLSVIEELVQVGHLRRVLLVGALRTEPGGAGGHPLLALAQALALPADAPAPGAFLEHLPLAGLDEPEVTGVVADCLGCTYAHAAPLGAEVHRATDGNPLRIVRLLQRLQVDGALWFDVQHGSWTWDLQGLSEGAPDEGSGSLTLWSLERLPTGAREIVQAASCLATEIDVERLALAGGWLHGEAVAALDAAMAEGLVQRCHSQGARDLQPALAPPVAYSFVHDQVREAVHDTLTEDRRAQLHLDLGRNLAAAWRRQGAEDLLLDAVEQLLRAGALQQSAADQRELATLGLAAGRAALRRAAWPEATRYLQVAAVALPKETDPALAWEIRRSLAISQQMQGRYGEAEANLERAAEQSGDRPALAEIYRLRAELLVQSGRLAEAIEVGLGGLGLYGPRYPLVDDVAAWEALARQGAAELDARLGGVDAASLLDLPPTTDAEARGELALLEAILLPAFLLPHVLPVLASRALCLSLAYGNAPETPLAYAIHALLCCAWGRYEAGQSFGRLALDLVERQRNLARRAPVTHIYVNWVNHWTRPIDTGLPHAIQAVGSALLCGDSLHAGRLAMNAACMLLERGTPLGDVLPQQQDLLRIAREEARSDEAVHVLEGLVHGTARLMDRMDVVQELEAAGSTPATILHALDPFPEAEAYLHYCWLLQATVLERPTEERRSYVEALRQRCGQANGLLLFTDVAFFEALLLCDEHAAAEEQQRPAIEAQVEAIHESLQAWAGQCPENHAYKRLLIVAELDRLRGRHAEAAEGYLKAYEAASADGFGHGAALAMERSALFHAAQGRAGAQRVLLRAAYEAYARWGAQAKLREMEAAHPFLRQQGAASPGPVALDADALIQVMRSFFAPTSGEHLTEGLVSSLLVHAGARRCALFLQREGRLVAEAVAAEDPESVAGASGAALQGSTMWPASPIRFVHRTGEAVMLDSVHQSPLFAADPWIRKHGTRALLCLPLALQGETRGVLYLDNELLDGAFPPERTEFARVLAELAAPALESARLYADLTRTSRELAAANVQLEQHVQALEQTIRERSRALVDLAREHQATVEALHEAVFRVDLAYRIQFANLAAFRITQYSAEELLGADPRELLQLGDLESPPLSPAGDTPPSAPAFSEPRAATLRRKDGTGPSSGCSTRGIRSTAAREGWKAA